MRAARNVATSSSTVFILSEIIRTDHRHETKPDVKESLPSSSCANFCAVKKNSIFWDITPCSPLKVDRRVRGTRRLHLHCRRISRSCFHAGFLLDLCFDPEDGGDMFLRNVGWFSTDYTALHART
jgi:hypothetical protein